MNDKLVLQFDDGKLYILKLLNGLHAIAYSQIRDIIISQWHSNSIRAY